MHDKIEVLWQGIRMYTYGASDLMKYMCDNGYVSPHMTEDILIDLIQNRYGDMVEIKTINMTNTDFTR